MSAPCIRCGEPGIRVVIESAMGDVYETWLCDPCIEISEDEAEENGRQFDELVAAGVPKDRANAIMIARMEGAEVS